MNLKLKNYMANIFKQSQDINNRPNRNNFDESFQVHGTYKPGVIYPVAVIPTVPGDSFRIKIDYGLKFMPLAFPVQTRMRVIFHVFQGYNRNVWKNFPNFIQGLEDHVHPYISQPNTFFKTGSLADYLGIPSTVVKTGLVDYTEYPLNVHQMLRLADAATDVTNDRLIGKYYRSQVTTQSAGQDATITPSDGQTIELSDGTTQTIGSATIPTYEFSYQSDVESETWVPVEVHLTPTIWRAYEDTTAPGQSFLTVMVVPVGQSTVTDDATIFTNVKRYKYASVFSFPRHLHKDDGAETITLRYRTNMAQYGISSVPTSTPVSVSVYARKHVDGTSFLQTNGSRPYILVATGLTYSSAEGTLVLPQTAAQKVLALQNDGSTVDLSVVYGSYSPAENQPNFAMVSIASLSAPVVADGDVLDAENMSVNIADNLKINALPFRHYEAIYNMFYRDWQNQPFVKDGVIQYNKYNTTTDDGADTTPYHLFERNWEKDWLTSCLPSPQQGAAPLVGLTSLGEIDITDEDGVRTFGRYQFEDDGKTFNGKISIHNPGESVENDRVLSRTAMSLIGLSINDFRNTNALQHWLETNIRKGYKYKDFIEGHFGKAPSNAALDMPEFVGGFSRPIGVNMISQTSASEAGQPLGSYAGQANAFSQGQKIPTINHYADDYGYMFVMMMIVPDPAYSQSLKKHFTYTDKLDYYFPEFAQLGMQPVPMKEVCPLQALEEDVSLYKTFGYNRPNYDMVQFYDEVHGQFRTSLRNYLIQRIYGQCPELGNEFLTISPDEVNNIFTFTAPDEDNIIGQIAFDIKAKRPVPRIHFPSLGK